MLCVFAVPSASPSEVSADGMSTTITVQWGPVEPCTDQNGAITSYSVRYRETESGSEQTVSTPERDIMISGVSTSRNYSVEVAAVNSAGTGVYSDPIFVTTESKRPSLHRFIHVFPLTFPRCYICDYGFCHDHLNSNKLDSDR